MASTLQINYNSEQAGAAEAPPVVETATWQIALSQTMIQSCLIPKEKGSFSTDGHASCTAARSEHGILVASDVFDRSCIVEVHILISSLASLSAFMSLCP